MKRISNITQIEVNNTRNKDKQFLDKRIVNITQHLMFDAMRSVAIENNSLQHN